MTKEDRQKKHDGGVCKSKRTLSRLVPAKVFTFSKKGLPSDYALFLKMQSSNSKRK
jgi:hypothetical protein